MKTCDKLAETSIDRYEDFHNKHLSDFKNIRADSVTFEADIYNERKTLNSSRAWRGVGAKEWHEKQLECFRSSFFCGGQSA